MTTAVIGSTGGPLVLVALTLPMMIWDSGVWLSLARWASALVG